MRLCDISRLLAVAAAVLLAAAAAPALAQTADVTVTLSPPARKAEPKTGINVDADNKYTAKLTNADGAARATNVVITVTAVPTPLEFVSFAGCRPVPTDPLSCSLDTVVADDPATTDVENTPVTITVHYPLTQPVPTTCNTGETVGALSVSVVAENDTTPATATVASTPVNPYADLEAVVTPASQDISSGGTMSAHVVMTNHGPCDAVGAAAEFSFPTALAFESAVDGTPPFCATAPLDDSPGDEDAVPPVPAGAFTDFGCDMGTLAVGESRSFDVVMRLASLPSDLLRGAYPFSVTAGGDTHNINPDNDTGTAPNRYDNDSGCSTGGAATLFGVAGLVALRLRRRRS